LRVGNTRGVDRHFHQQFEAEFLTVPYTFTYIFKFWTVFDNTPKYIPNSACIGTMNYIYRLLVILLGLLASRIKIFGEAPPKFKAR
jgi:hypothetical protein